MKPNTITGGLKVFLYSNWQHYSKKCMSLLVALYFFRAGMAVLDKPSSHLQKNKDRG
jgi:hypothetical protein